MRISLKIRTYSSQPPADQQIRVFDSFPIIIGRSSSCNYILNDPTRYISSNHAVILLKDSTLLIQDTSANGVYINGDVEPVGRGQNCPLNHEDGIAIGEYTLSITINSQPTQFRNIQATSSVEENRASAHRSAGSSAVSSDSLDTLPNPESLRGTDFEHLKSTEVLEQTGKLVAQMTDALTKRLSSKNDGYLHSEKAIQEAVEELKTHQLAMLEGMNSAVTSLLLRFDPDKLAAKLVKTEGIPANIPVNPEAKLWELFCKQYDTICAEAVCDFSDLFAAEFIKVYETSIKKTDNRTDFEHINQDSLLT